MQQQRTQTSSLNNAAIAALMDKTFWNEQGEIVLALFPDVEEEHPTMGFWFELKDSRPDTVAKLKADGHTVLSYGAHAWLGCDSTDVHARIHDWRRNGWLGPKGLQGLQDEQTTAH